MAEASDTHHPAWLYEASVERIDTARHLAEVGEDPVAAVYLAGVAVELVLQALSHLDDPRHDARHDLRR